MAFVPLLILGETRGRGYWMWVCFTFFVWIMATTWWVGISTPVATVAVPLVGLFFTVVPFMLFHWFRGRAPAITAWSIFVTAWISFEALYTYNQISFPWLTLGNGFASTPYLVQWYELTGAFSGTLWVLISNILCYQVWRMVMARRAAGRGSVRLWPALTAALLWIGVPMVASLIRYATYRPVGTPVKITVIQPNIDPYTEKFGALTPDEQRDMILSLAEESPSDVRFVVTPETAFDGDFWLNGLGSNPQIDTLRRFMASRPDATLIAGATTFRMYGIEQSHPITATAIDDGRAYDIYNSALGIAYNVPQTQVYHKSRLVCGAETIPYPHVLSFLEYFAIDLGGISGNLGSQPERSLIWAAASPDRNLPSVPVGVAICYESIYGEYFTEYIQKGASLMMIITNDGWWGDTWGHRHHFDYARLRAIETRRSIARSANTGISGFIDSRGDVLSSLGWDRQGVLTESLQSDTTITPYVRFGDWVVRISWLVLALSLLYYVSWSYKKRARLVE